MPIFIHFFSIFWRFKTRNFEQNHRQGSRTWWSRQFYRDKIQSNPRSPWYIWWFFRENLTFWGIFKVQFVLPSSIFVSFTSHRSRGVVVCWFVSSLIRALFEKMSKLRGVENAHTWRHMVRLTRRSTKILDFSIPKLLSELQIYTSLKKNSKLAKNNRRKKPKNFLKKSNYLTKKSTNWTPRLLSCPIRANSVFYSTAFPPSLFLFSSCFASAGCLRMPHMGRLNNRRVRFSIFYSIAFPP